MSDVLYVTDSNFDQEIINSNLPAMVDFWADWCGPCKIVGPIIEELAKEYKGRVKIAKLNVDQNRQITSRYGIRNIPTMILFKDGKVVDTIIGAYPKSFLEERLKSLL